MSPERIFLKYSPTDPASIAAGAASPRLLWGRRVAFFSPSGRQDGARSSFDCKSSMYVVFHALCT